MVRLRHVLRSGALNIAFQLLFLAALYYLGREARLPDGGTGRFGLLVLVLVPSAVWTGFFYLQDRIEKEPARHVLLSFLAGMAGASLLALPLEQVVFRLPSWIYTSLGHLAAGATFIVGATACFVIYLVVRCGLYPLDAFDEPVDGMVYGAFAGSGYALVRSLVDLSGRPEFTLFAIGYTAAVNILTYASVGALVGYFVGRAKFSERGPQRGFFVAVLSGSVLLGLYHLLVELIFVRSLANALWVSFLLTAVLATLLLGFVFLRMRSLTSQDLRARVTGRGRLDPAVLVLFLAFLAAGAATRAHAIAARPFRDAELGVSFRYAAVFTPQPAAETMVGEPVSRFLGLATRTLFRASAGGEGQGRLTVRVPRAPGPIEVLDVLQFIETGEPLAVYKDDIDVAGRAGVRLKYAFLAGGDPMRELLPELRWAYTDLVPAGDSVMIFSFHATPLAFARREAAYLALLDSFRIDGDAGRAEP